MSGSERSLRTALVLGGGSDIAAAIVDELAEAAGLERALLAMRDTSAAPAAPAGVATTVVGWDALDVDSHAGLVARAAEELGSIDVVICAVGMLGHHAGRSMSPQDVETMARTNYAGPAAALAAAAEQLAQQDHGTLVVLSSVAGARPRRSNYVYGSSKSGLDAFARGLGDALHGTGVKVLVVRPGFVRSSMTEGLDPAPMASTPQQVAQAVVSRLRTGRGGVLWVPRVLGPMFAVLSNVPAPLWRRIAAER